MHTSCSQNFGIELPKYIPFNLANYISKEWIHLVIQYRERVKSILYLIFQQFIFQDSSSTVKKQGEEVAKVEDFKYLGSTVQLVM